MHLHPRSLLALVWDAVGYSDRILLIPKSLSSVQPEAETRTLSCASVSRGSGYA